jgi:predicted amidohydrolase YtcJ
MGYGHDDTLMPAERTLHREDLDTDFPVNPVIVQHVSLHSGVLNSAALRKWGITADTPTPPGG